MGLLAPFVNALDDRPWLYCPGAAYAGQSALHPDAFAPADPPILTPQELVIVRRERILHGVDFDEDTVNKDGCSPEEKRDLFGSLVRSSLESREQDGGSPISDIELRSNVFIFLLAGHETTANSLSFTLALLALHPDIQQKLYEEVVVGGENGELVRGSIDPPLLGLS